MGTNYYAKLNFCPTCKHSEDEIHLGKSSVGWKFHIQANNFSYYTTWLEMQKWLQDKRIFNEYGDELRVDEFVNMVETKQATEEPKMSGSDYASLQRRTIDGYEFYNVEFS